MNDNEKTEVQGDKVPLYAPCAKCGCPAEVIAIYDDGSCRIKCERCKFSYIQIKSE